MLSEPTLDYVLGRNLNSLWTEIKEALHIHSKNSFFGLYFSFLTWLLCYFLCNFLSVLSLSGRNRHLHQVWGEEVFLIIDFQSPLLVLRLHIVFWQWAKSTTNIMLEMHFHKFHNVLEVNVVMERLFCTFFSWTYIYIGNCMYIFKYCYCVIVIHFVNLLWIHDLVAVMKPILERSCLLWDCAWDQIMFDMRIMRSLSSISNVVKNIFYVLKSPCSFAAVVTTASSMFLPIIPSS